MNEVYSSDTTASMEQSTYNDKNNKKDLQRVTLISACYFGDDHKCCFCSQQNRHSLSSGTLRPFLRDNNNIIISYLK